MSSTKIINVLRDDSFDEILDIFNRTPAQEVIFVLPKTAKALKKEHDFATLSDYASNQNKNVSILCSNPNVNKLAKKYKFDILLAKDDESISNIKTVNQLEDPPPWGNHDLPGLEPVINPEPIPAMSKVHDVESIIDNEPEHKIITAVKIKKVEDIISPEDEESKIKISPKKEKEAKISIKKDILEKEFDFDSGNKKDIGIWADWKTEPKKEVPKKGARLSKFKFNARTVLASLVIASVFLFGTIIYISSGEARVIIKPKKDLLDLKFKVTASDMYNSVDSNLNRIPGQAFKIEKSMTQTFAATSQKDAVQKARGKITVYNELNTPQPLIATTRFESEKGLVFRTLKTITVPAGKAGIPGKTEVEVIADKPGQEYNTATGKFMIMAFREKNDTEKYQKIYGQAKDQMHGGINGKSTVVSETDHASAKQTIINKLSAELDSALKSQGSQFKVINTGGVVFGDPDSSAKPDDAASEFTMTINGSIKAIGIKEDDLYKLINEYTQKNKNLEIVPEKIDITYENIKLSDAGNMVEFDLSVKGNGYFSVVRDQIINDLLGMSSKEVRHYFEGKESIESAKVLLSPIWVFKVPKNKESIIYEVEY